MKSCPHCGGTGQVETVSEYAVLCPICGGSGYARKNSSPSTVLILIMIAIGLVILALNEVL